MAIVTMTQALKKLYKAIVGEETKKNNPTKIVSDLADNWSEGITVESLSVTENDTYTAPAGKAYSPVTVNVSGGSSDFSTATLTVTNNTTGFGGFAFNAPTVETVPIEPSLDFLGGLLHIDSSKTQVYTLALYKGNAMINGFKDGSYNTITPSGNIETLQEGMYLATGDCTITIS